MLERHWLTLKEEMEHSSERLEVLTVLMNGQDFYAEDSASEKYQEKICGELKELEEERTKEALELVQTKHKLTKWEGERERARTLQRLEVSRASRSVVRSPRQFLLQFVLIFHRRSDVCFLQSGTRFG